MRLLSDGTAVKLFREKALLKRLSQPLERAVIASRRPPRELRDLRMTDLRKKHCLAARSRMKQLGLANSKTWQDYALCGPVSCLTTAPTELHGSAATK